MLVSAILSFPASTAVQAMTFGDYVTTGILQFYQLDQDSISFSKYAVGIALLGTVFFDKFKPFLQLSVPGSTCTRSLNTEDIFK